MSYADSRKIVEAKGCGNEPVVVLGIRGLYSNSMGVVGVNDRGLYDDGGFITTPEAGAEWETRGVVPAGFPKSGIVGQRVYGAFNFNTDPSGYRNGEGFGERKGMAVLDPGLYYAHIVDLHKGDVRREALCQRVGPVDVHRDGVNGGYAQRSAYIGANIHDGGMESTWSECCQTVPKFQFPEFMTIIKGVLRKTYGFEDFYHTEVGSSGVAKRVYLRLCVPYLLIDEKERREICR